MVDPTEVGEVTGKILCFDSEFCQFYIDFQGHEVGLGLGMELGAKSRCMSVGFCPSLGQQSILV